MYMRYAKYIKSDLKLLKGKILKMKLWTVTGESSKSFPFPPWPFMAFAVTLILENITARIIFWHSNVIASTSMCGKLLPCSFGYLTSVTNKEPRCSGCLMLWPLTPRRPTGPTPCSFLDTISLSIIDGLTKKGWGVGALKFLWLVIMPSSSTTSHTSARTFPPSPSAGSAAIWRRLSGEK